MEDPRILGRLFGWTAEGELQGMGEPVGKGGKPQRGWIETGVSGDQVGQNIIY